MAFSALGPEVSPGEAFAWKTVLVWSMPVFRYKNFLRECRYMSGIEKRPGRARHHGPRQTRFGETGAEFRRWKTSCVHSADGKPLSCPTGPVGPRRLCSVSQARFAVTGTEGGHSHWSKPEAGRVAAGAGQGGVGALWLPWAPVPVPTGSPAPQGSRLRVLHARELPRVSSAGHLSPRARIGQCPRT